MSRVQQEWVVEAPLLRARWKVIGVCLALQYVHGIFTQLVFRLHAPAPEPLKDLGFLALPELGPRHFWISEALFVALFASFLVWLLSPFWSERRAFYTVVVAKRLLVHLCCCQALRVLSFMSTILPGPAHHCRAGEASASRAWPRHWWQHLVVDVQRQAGRSCGDLIFSSHTTFILAFVLCYTYYGQQRLVKAAYWVLAAILSLLIVASRKHYTVDIVVAWYTVPLVFLALERRWTTRRSEGELYRALADVTIGDEEARAAEEGTAWPWSRHGGHAEAAGSDRGHKVTRAGTHNRSLSASTAAARSAASPAEGAGGPQRGGSGAHPPNVELANHAFSKLKFSLSSSVLSSQHAMRLNER